MILYINVTTSYLQMAKRRERRHLNKLLNNGGVATEGEVKIQHDITCSICLDEMDTKRPCYYTLDCGHCFHSDCLLKWYKKSSSNHPQVVIPFADLMDIQFFPQDTNCMRCPVCNAQYTMELVMDKVTGKVSQKDYTLKRILGRINMVFCDDETRAGLKPMFMTHYATRVDTFKLFSPVIDIEDDNGEPMTLYMRL